MLFCIFVGLLRLTQITCLLITSKMCSQIPGCTRYIFTDSRLDCQLSYQECSKLPSVKNHQNESCTLPGKCIITREGMSRCVAITATVCKPVNDEDRKYNVNFIPTVSTKCRTIPQQPEACTSVLKDLASKRLGIDSGLFFVPAHKTAAIPYHQLIFKTITLKTYSHINRYTVAAVTFISNLQKLLISSRNRGIYAYTLDTKTETKFLKSSAYSISVDDDDDLVFFLPYRRHYISKNVQKITTSGKGRKTVKKYNMFCLSVALDQKNNWIYVALKTGLKKCTYAGIGTVSKKKVLFGLTVGPEGHVYFAEGKSLFALDAGYSTRLLASFDLEPLILISDEIYIHMTFLNSDKYGTFHVANGMLICNFEIGYKAVSYLVVLIK